MKQIGLHLNRFPLPTETFVIEQARVLARYKPVFFVRKLLTHVAGLDVRTIPDSAWDWRRRLFALAPDARVWGGDVAADLFHAHFGTNGLYAGVLADACNAPLVVTFHGFDGTTRRMNLLLKGGVGGARLALRRSTLFHRADRIIAVSRFLASELLSAGVPESRLTQHYIGVDTARFQPLASRIDSQEIVCVGRLIELKGQNDLLRAFSMIAAEFPEARLSLIGDGPERGNLERLVRELGVGRQVSFEGVLPHSEVAARVREAAVCVSASRTALDGAREALGLASLEAAASGIPSIVTRSGGLPETVRDGLTGVVVAEASPGELADALRTMLRDRGQRERMGAAARAFVLESFDLRRQTARLEELYDDVLGTR